MSTDPAVASQASPPPARPQALVSEYGIAEREDGAYLDLSVPGHALVASVDNILLANNYFVGLDYPLLVKALYGWGPALPPLPPGQGWLRFASGVNPFDRARRDLYRAVKINDGRAEYYFEPVFLPDPQNPDGAGVAASLDLDEFIADMWLKGIRFGIDVDALRAAIGSGQAGRVVIARRLDPVPGQDARVIEVSEYLHRNDAPRQLADGRLDLNSFQNRFPQILAGVRLLQKIPRAAGEQGFELSGIVIEPPVPADLDLQSFCGLGTAVERTGEGEYVVSQQAGFLAVDPKTNQVSVSDKVVSHDGVSAKTTGNLQLTGDYEEFGEVQEKRVIEGEGITVHADVFGNLVSRGGTIQLNRNLVGGSAHNDRGDIIVRGVSSSAVIQARCGEVVLQRAENCVVSGTRVTIDHAVNCEIIGEQVTVGQAEGCAIAGRNVTIESTAPRRQGEMVVYAQVPDCARIDEVIALTRERAGQLGQLAALRKAEMDRLADQPNVRKYMRLASAVRKNEITLTPEQVPQFQKMALAVGPALKEIGKISLEMKAFETDRQAGLELAANLERQRDCAGVSRVSLRLLQGDTQVRIMMFNPDGSTTYDLPAREIKARLRGTNSAALLHAGDSGSFEWNSAQGASPAPHPASRPLD